MADLAPHLPSSQNVRRSPPIALIGLFAGVVFALAEMIAAALMGTSVLMPWRAFASVVFGQYALSAAPGAVAFIVGAIVHFGLSVIYGTAYAALNDRRSFELRRSKGSQAALGALFGLLLWLVNFQVIARLLYPWFLRDPQPLQAALHALFFGLPLGLLYAVSERPRGALGAPRTA